MNIAIVITPGGLLRIAEAADSLPEVADAAAAALEKAFSRSNAEGLLLLASQQDATRVAGVAGVLARLGSASFFKPFVSWGKKRSAAGPRFRSPAPSILSDLVADAPPTVGLEYLNVELLRSIWNELRERASAEAKKFAGRAGGLSSRAQSALAFARPRDVSSGGKQTRSASGRSHFWRPTRIASRARHAWPICRWPRRSKPTPARRICRSSNRCWSRCGGRRSGAGWPASCWTRKALFAPQAWSIRQAYRFLKEAPLVEEAGVVVRLPDWWSGRRPPRPQVQVQHRRQADRRPRHGPAAEFQHRHGAGRRAAHGRRAPPTSRRHAKGSRCCAANGSRSIRKN